MGDSPIINVKNIISLFEKHTDGKTTSTNLRRSKSLRFIDKPIKSIYNNNNHKQPSKVKSIEEKVKDLQSELDAYKIYSKETQIHYQNEVFLILSQVVQSDDLNNREKSEFMELFKQISRELNSRLPSESFGVNGVQENNVNLVENGTNEENTDGVKQNVEENFLGTSVKKLKSLFEIKSNEPKGLKQFSSNVNSPKIIDNTTSSFKYVPYSQRMVHSVSIVRSNSQNKLVDEDTPDADNNLKDIKSENNTDANLNEDELISNEVSEIIEQPSVYKLVATYNQNYVNQNEDDSKKVEKIKIEIEGKLDAINSAENNDINQETVNESSDSQYKEKSGHKDDNDVDGVLRNSDDEFWTAETSVDLGSASMVSNGSNNSLATYEDLDKFDDKEAN